MAIQTSANNQVTVLSASWNSATTPYTALKVDVNNILTPSSSLLLDVGTNTGTYVSRFAIDVSGSVGIGTAAPSGKFEVVGVSGSLLLVTDALSGSLFSVNDITGLPIFEVFSDDTVVAGAVNSNALVVTGSRVGIGSRTPGYVLDVAPTTATARVGTTLLGAWPANTSYAFFGHNSLTQTGSGNYAIIQSNAGSTFVNAASGNTLSLRINDTAALTVDSSRYVGIGTVTPGTALHVRDASLTEQLRLMGSGAGYMYAGYDQANNRGKFGAYTGASFTNLLINEGGGNVGIGVNTNPVTTLDVNGVINTATGFRIANAATPAGRYLRADGTNFVSSAIVAGDVPTLNQNTTGQAGSVANAVTFNNGGAGDASGTTFNGSAARTISYNTVGAPSTTGTNASGTWGISISGNAATATSAATLTTARNINGTSFNGSADITVPVNTSQRSDNVTYHVPFVAAVTAGNQSLFTDSLAELTYNPSTNTLTTTTFAGALSGNATTSTTLQTSRTLWGRSFNGSADVIGSLTSVGDITGTGAVTLTATNGTLGLAATLSNVITATTNGTEALRIDSSQRVGIGTATITAARMHVQGTSTGSDTTLLVRHGIANGSNLPVLNVQNSAGTSLLFVSGSGNIGIGTNTPTARLHINTAGTSVDGPALKINHSAGSGYGYAQFGDSSTATQNWHIGSEGDGSFRWYSGTWGAGSELMRINSAGNVGIGTNNPTTRLFIRTTTSNDGLYLNSTGNIRISPGGNLGTGAFNDIVVNGDSAILFDGGSAGTGNFVIAPWTAAAGQVYGLRMTSAGNVGIGTTAPTSRLTVFNTAEDATLDVRNSGASNYPTVRIANGTRVWAFQVQGSSSRFDLIDDTGSVRPIQVEAGSSIDSALIIKSSGTVGIKVTPPSATITSKLYVNSDVTLAGTNRALLGNLYYDTDWRYAGNGYGWGFREDGGGKVQIVRAGSNSGGSGATASVNFDLFTFDLVNNRIGIGTQSPGVLLDAYNATSTQIRANAGGTVDLRVHANTTSGGIVGTYSNTDLVLFTNSTEKMRIDTSGNTAIGTNNAGGYRLSVRTTAAYASSKFESAVTANSTTLDAGEFFQMSANTANSSVTFGAADGRVLTANVTPSSNEVVWRANKMGLVAGDYIVFKPSGGTEIMRITAGLKVGIGTNNPSSNVTRLDVRNEGVGGISGPTSGFWTAQIVNNNDISTYNGLSVHNRWAASDSIIFEAAAGWNGSAAGYYPVFTVLGNGTSIFKNNAGTEIARVDSGGTVGVGTATISTARMQIQGTSTGSDTTLRVRHNVLNGSNLPVLDVQNQAGTSLLFVSGSGRIGIGSTTPGTPLDIVGGSTSAPVFPSLRLRQSVNNGYGFIQLGDSSTNSNNWHIGSEGDGRFLFYNGAFGSGTERLRLTNSTGDLTIATGNLVIGTSGKGIDFSATAGTGTSELLDDYEEGTWSPTFTCGTSGTITVDTASGETQARYTKIGRVVHIAASIGISAVSSPSGFLQINNLPFASAATWAAFNGVAGYAEHYLGTGYASTFGCGQVQIYSSDSILYYSYYTTSAGWASLSAARFTAASYLGFSFTYLTDA